MERRLKQEEKALKKTTKGKGKEASTSQTTTDLTPSANSRYVIKHTLAPELIQLCTS